MTGSGTPKRPRNRGPFAAFERMIAWRYLRPGRKEGFISVIAAFSFLGIALGVATLIIVMSVMNGFRHELLSRVLGFNGHVFVLGVGGRVADFDATTKRIAKLPDVISAQPVIDGQVLAAANNQQSGAFIRGIRKADLERLLTPSKARGAPNRNRDTLMSTGSTKEFTGRTIIIGYRMAIRLNIRVGNSIRLISPQGPPNPLGAPLPRIGTFKVIGTFDFGMSEYDRGYVFMPLKTAQVFFLHRNTVSNIEVRVAKPTEAETVAQHIVNLRLRNVRVRTWQEVHSTFVGALKVERNVMFLILTLIIVVAAFNIVSSLIMLVKDKTQAIAILRTMGATRGSIMRIFFLSGASIGIFGTLIGAALGLVITDNIGDIKEWLEEAIGSKLFPSDVYFLSRLPAIIDWTEVGQVVGMGLGLSFLATIYPSWRAARLDPVEALRYE